MQKIFKKFLEHPRSVGETYFQHFIFAFQISLEAAIISFLALAHAFLPFLFLYSASIRLERLNQKIKNRRKSHE